MDVLATVGYLRQHERVTKADREQQARISDLLVPGTSAVVAHLIAPDDQRTAMRAPR